MGALFGKTKKVSRVTEQDKAVLQLKQQRDKLKVYQKKMEIAIEKDRNLARKLLQEGMKDRAKLLLRKKKFQEQIIEKTDGQLENLERLVHDIEFAQIEIQVLEGLKTGNQALKKVNEILNIDEVEKILEETREGVEKQKEIDEMLSGALTQADEDDVEAELDEIIKLALPNVPSAEEVNLPEVPEDRIEKPQKIRKKPVALEAS